jgi:hypothetical protein
MTIVKFLGLFLSFFISFSLAIDCGGIFGAWFVRTLIVDNSVSLPTLCYWDCIRGTVTTLPISSPLGKSNLLNYIYLLKSPYSF